MAASCLWPGGNDVLSGRVLLSAFFAASVSSSSVFGAPQHNKEEKNRDTPFFCCGSVAVLGVPPGVALSALFSPAISSSRRVREPLAALLVLF